MNNPSDTLKNNKLKCSTRPVRRIMGFREWCDKVYEPSKQMRLERWFPWGEKFFNKDQETVHERR
jgi:hypothetical protein